MLALLEKVNNKEASNCKVLVSQGCNAFKYLGSTVHKDGDALLEVGRRRNVAW